MRWRVSFVVGEVGGCGDVAEGGVEGGVEGEMVRVDGEDKAAAAAVEEEEEEEWEDERRACTLRMRNLERWGGGGGGGGDGGGGEESEAGVEWSMVGMWQACCEVGWWWWGRWRARCVASCFCKSVSGEGRRKAEMCLLTSE